MTSVAPGTTQAPDDRGDLPRIGFAGVGWIGRDRMRAAVTEGVLEVAAVADISIENRHAVGAELPGVSVFSSFEDLLEADLDGVVIATPSALHAHQCLAALARGLPVFCQKPLARTAAETRNIVEAARDADLLLGVDLAYRWTQGLRAMSEIVRAGGIGKIFAVDLVFHNAYGPDKPWFLDPKLSGGGAVVDLGTHLVDGLLWMLEWPEVIQVSSRLFHRGRPIADADPSTSVVEDYGVAELDLDGGARARMACSWFLHAGRDAVIEFSFYGDRGSVSMYNVGGSFYDFTAELRRGTSTTTLASPPDAWGGRAIVEWARGVGEARGFDQAATHLVRVAEVLDRIYGRSG